MELRATGPGTRTGRPALQRAGLVHLPRFNPFSASIRLLSSVRLALAIILVIAVVVLAGTVVDQAPPSVVTNHAAYQQWLERAHGKYGWWADAFDRLQLFNVFHSWFFRTAMGLLAASIAACTTRRWRGIWNTVFHTPVRATDVFVAHARFHSELRGGPDPAATAEQVARELRRAHYRVRLEPGDGTIAIFGDKNRLSRFGTFFSHLSLLLMLGGAIIGGVWGFKDPEFVVAEGSTRDLGLGTGVAVRLDRFNADYYTSGQPKDYSSEITILRDGRPVSHGTVQVNSPLRYDGIAFHESFFGQAAIIHVRDATGREIYSGGVPLARQTRSGDRPIGTFELPELGAVAYITGPALNGADNLIHPGEVRLELFQDYVRVAQPVNLSQGTPRAVGGLTFTFERESPFAGLQVVKNPGTNVVWVASALMLLGLVMVFYMPRRRVWVLCTAAEGGGTRVRMAMPGGRDAASPEEFDRLSERIGGAVGAAKPNRDSEGDQDV